MKKIKKLLFELVLIVSSQNIIAEEVMVKYIGRVNLNEYVCRGAVSSVVKRICYNEKNRNMILLLQDTYYSYCGINKQVVYEFESARSLGKYLNENIRGQYNC